MYWQTSIVFPLFVRKDTCLQSFTTMQCQCFKCQILSIGIDKDSTLEMRETERRLAEHLSQRSGDMEDEANVGMALNLSPGIPILTGDHCLLLINLITTLGSFSRSLRVAVGAS